MFALRVSEAVDRLFHRVHPPGSRARDEGSTGLGEHHIRAARIRGVSFSGGEIVVDTGLHETTSAGLVDADPLGDFTYRERCGCVSERLECAESSRELTERAALSPAESTGTGEGVGVGSALSIPVLTGFVHAGKRTSEPPVPATGTMPVIVRTGGAGRAGTSQGGECARNALRGGRRIRFHGASLHAS